MDLYAENILDHGKHPRNSSPLDEPSIRHTEKNLSCGDTLTLDLRIENGVIVAVGWQGEGCAISQAGMSILSEELKGISTEKALQLSEEDIRALLGVPISTRRLKCALLCLHTLKNTLQAFAGKQPFTWAETVGNDAHSG